MQVHEYNFDHPGKFNLMFQLIIHILEQLYYSLGLTPLNNSKFISMVVFLLMRYFI